MCCRNMQYWFVQFIIIPNLVKMYELLYSLPTQAIQRSSLEEQVCVLYRIRQGHFCQSSVVVVIIVQWEGENE